MSQIFSLTLTDWKSFGSTRNQIQFAPLTLLVGPNASGKSNALDALRFLQGAALDFPFGDVLRGRWEGQREIWPAIRGQTVETARWGSRSFTLESVWHTPGPNSDLRESSVEHRIGIDLSEDVSLIREYLGDEDGYAFDTHVSALTGALGLQPGGGIKAALRASGKGNSQVEVLSARRSLLGQVEQKGRVKSEVIEKARSLQRSMREVVFLDIEPARMRDYRPEFARAIGTSGENVSSVLADLNERDRADIVDWLGELCAPSLQGIDFDRTQLREVMFFLREAGDRQVSARSVSDGTLRFLGLVTALLTAVPGSIIVLEEPDVGLHPSRIHLLAGLLEQVTSERRIQIVATTHSPTLLAHLSEESLGNVVALGRDDQAMTVCSRLEDLPHFATLRDSKALEHLVSTGWIERAL